MRHTPSHDHDVISKVDSVEVVPEEIVPQRLCREDNWDLVFSDPVPRAVRWSRRQDRFSNPVWTKWHYTEGNGAFTACGQAVVLFEVDGSPQEMDLSQVNCRHCRASINQIE